MEQDAEHLDTKMVRTRVSPSGHREHASSIYMTSSFMFDNAEQARAAFAREIDSYIYTRYANPNVSEFVEKMCLLEGAEAGVAVASGMSAVFSAMAALLNSGDHILAARSVFGSTHQLLTNVFPRWGISHTYGDLHNTAAWEELVQPNTRLCVVESPSNPALDLIDLAWLGRFCRQREIILLVDNVFATPILQTPLHLGAHLVMHSVTKFVDGQGRGIGGILVGEKHLIDEVANFTRHTGPSLSPFNAWMFSKSLETLPLRIERHCDNAERVAEFLFDHPQVKTVKYPHHPSHPQYELAKKQMCRGGALVTFEITGGLDQGRRFLDSMKMMSLTPNLGDSRTTVTHPASTTHSSLSEEARHAVGITPGLIRISVGLEHVDDIIADLKHALEGSIEG
ncbi:MAG: aminotransferase class I/II-fold pyridoxal phosphate-dependent enzyme [Ardenticatenaceae bacterium]|nr:aminotransferase class I/II-fold pyridoxal phosphate-dependent enzyme [Ardenticatenaceae bacterium]